MATKKQTQDLMERALARAAQDGIHVEEDGGDHWLVRGSDGVTRYTVQTTDEGLCCTCPARHYCKHRAVCQQRLNEQQAEREKFGVAAGAALVMAERGGRTLAGRCSARKIACGRWRICQWRLHPMPWCWDQRMAGSGTRLKKSSGIGTRRAAVRNAGIKGLFSVGLAPACPAPFSKGA